jgi:hypothetical protein
MKQFFMIYRNTLSFGTMLLVNLDSGLLLPTFIFWALKLSTSNKLSYIKQYSNQSGLTEYNSGVRLPLPT